MIVSPNSPLVSMVACILWLVFSFFKYHTLFQWYVCGAVVILIIIKLFGELPWKLLFVNFNNWWYFLFFSRFCEMGIYIYSVCYLTRFWFIKKIGIDICASKVGNTASINSIKCPTLLIHLKWCRILLRLYWRYETWFDNGLEDLVGILWR